MYSLDLGQKDPQEMGKDNPDHFVDAAISTSD
jgi:hypothetical protein